MVKLKTTRYELLCLEGEYDRLVIALEQAAYSHERRDQAWPGLQDIFVMPNGQVRISLIRMRERKKDTPVDMNTHVDMIVDRTIWKEPNYIKSISKAFWGKRTHYWDNSVNVEGIINNHLNAIEDRRERKK